MHDNSWTRPEAFIPALALLIVTWWLASPFTIRHTRVVQRVGLFMVSWLRDLAEWWSLDNLMTGRDISPHFWINRTMPK